MKLNAGTSSEAAKSDSEYAIDWSECPDVEQVPGKVSGQWIVKATRILAEGVIENAQGGVSLEELTTDVYPNLGIERARRIIIYARAHAPRLNACVLFCSMKASLPLCGTSFFAVTFVQPSIWVGLV